LDFRDGRSNHRHPRRTFRHVRFNPCHSCSKFPLEHSTAALLPCSFLGSPFDFSRPP
jgi:hypothetical protein